MTSPQAPQTSKLFGNLFAALAQQLRGRLAATRASLKHAGAKGTQVEQAFREALAQYLPRRVALGQGEVIDTHGRRSNQTDVLVVSEDHPFNFGPDDPGLFLVEGILAAGEVKSVLTSADLDAAIASSRHFKTLRALPGPGTMQLSAPGDAHLLECPPWFLFAFESQLTTSTIAERLVAESNNSGKSVGHMLDAVFLLDRGEVINLGEGTGSFGVVLPSGAKQTGWIRHDGDEVLFALIAWLSLVMPRTRRIAPILPDYLVATHS